MEAVGGGIVIPSPYTLHSTLYTPHQSHQIFTLHTTPYTLHSTYHTLQPKPYTLHPTPYTLHPTPYTKCKGTFCVEAVGGGDGSL